MRAKKASKDGWQSVSGLPSFAGTWQLGWFAAELMVDWSFGFSGRGSGRGIVHMAKRWANPVMLVVWMAVCTGCDRPGSPTSPGSGQTVRADSATTSNRQVTLGRPDVTEEIEKEIYRSLNHRRKMMAAIAEKSGSSRGYQQMQEELGLLTKGFMSRYGLSEAEIAGILAKGDAGSWE